MQLNETTPPPANALPVAGFRAHLRLGTGFADDTTQDDALAAYLRAAIAVIEARTGKALITRGFQLILPSWRWSDSQALPVAPVSAISAVTMRAADGAGQVVDPARWRLVGDTHRPRLVARGAMLPTIPRGGQAEIDFEAGFAPDWAGVPADLAQAVFLLAAQYHEGRSGAAPDLPVSVAGLLTRWVPMRLSARGQV
ncbi:MAG: head-tail connector protein [Pararhodobacter sp.]